MKTIINAERSGALWMVEYAEFKGQYYLHNTEYKLQKYIEKILQERTVLPREIEELLELQRNVILHNVRME